MLQDASTAWNTAGAYPPLDAFIADCLHLVRLFRAGSKYSGAWELFIARAAAVKKAWSTLFPIHLPTFSFRPSVHAVLDHAPGYAREFGDRWSVMCSAEPGEKEHQRSQAFWKASWGTVTPFLREHACGAAHLLRGPMRQKITEVLLEEHAACRREADGESDSSIDSVSS